MLGVGDGLGDGLDAPDLAGIAREGQADGPDAAVEVEDALPAGEGRSLADQLAQSLRHLGVRLEEGHR